MDDRPNPDLSAARESLRTLVELIDAGSIESTAAEHAYLAGALSGMEISEGNPLRETVV